MAKARFLRNLHTAVRSLSPAVHVNGIRLDDEHLGELLRRATLWLTPTAVQGFDPADFPQVPPEERDRLTGNVEKFEAIARAVSEGRPASEAQVREASLLLLAILSTMGPYLEGFKVYSALKLQKFPDFVRDFAIKVGEDSTGDPSVWVWLIVTDAAAAAVKKLVKQLPAISQQVDEALEDANIDAYPYVRVRSLSDQLDLERTLAR